MYVHAYMADVEAASRLSRRTGSWICKTNVSIAREPAALVKDLWPICVCWCRNPHAWLRPSLCEGVEARTQEGAEEHERQKPCCAAYCKRVNGNWAMMQIVARLCGISSSGFKDIVPMLAQV